MLPGLEQHTQLLISSILGYAGTLIDKQVLRDAYHDRLLALAAK